MKRKVKGSTIASMALFITSGAFASVLGVRHYDRATTEMGWVTSTAVHAGQVISASMLKQERIKQDRLGLDNPRQIIGQKLKVAKAPGEPLHASDLMPPSKPVRSTLAQRIPEGRVLYSLQLGSSQAVPISQFHGGDRLDVLVRGRHGVRTAATDVQLIGVLRPRSNRPVTTADDKITSLLPQKPRAAAEPGAGTTLVLAVMPEHVYPLAHIAQQDAISLVLHSAYDVASGKTVSVTPSSTERAVEVVAGLNRSTVFVRR